METDRDLLGGSVIANPLDEQLNRLDLPVAIHLFPLANPKLCRVLLPQPLQDRLLNRARWKRFTGTCCPTLALRVETDIIRILSIVLPGVRIYHPRRAR